MKADVLCAWCGKFMHVGETPDGEPAPGICPACVRAHFSEVAPKLDLPDPTPWTAPPPTYQYAQFFPSEVYHLTSDPRRTLCGRRIEGRSLKRGYEGLVTKHQPKGYRLCTDCASVIKRRSDNQNIHFLQTRA